MTAEKPPVRRGRRSRPPAPTSLPPRPEALTVVGTAGPPARGDVPDDAPPAGLGDHGRRLWAAVTGDYELERHELELLEQAARTGDLIDALVTATADGVLLDAKDRMRAEIVELRQQRITYARLLAALRVPLGAEQDDAGHGPARLQRRTGARGVYRPRGVS